MAVKEDAQRYEMERNPGRSKLIFNKKTKAIDIVRSSPMTDQGRVYKVTDHTGEWSRHLAIGKEEAIQAHLIHYGLLGLNHEPTVEEEGLLEKWKWDGVRREICWDKFCCQAAFEKIF